MERPPGSGDFCLLVANPVEPPVERLRDLEIEILAGPDERIGAMGKIRSVYFRDPDGSSWK
ncbi:MAG: hypothetical protein QNK05_24305 [Myxococcota bacterium]|nr:hypothetical protein [Myxococcota bacterium]